MERFGVHAREVRSAIVALGGGWREFDDLVRETALPRRTLEELLDDLGGDVEWDGTAVRLRPGAARTHLDRAGTPAEVAPDLLAEIERHIRDVPPALPALDHVQATAETVLRRARWLDEQYDLRRTRVLFLGDHDLTALAVLAVRPEADLTVVDVDDRTLAYLDRHGRGAIRTVYADLRFGLPLAVAGSADVVFSDPPYTPEGMALFAARAIECLTRPQEGRVLLAYGYSPRHPALGHQVQRALLGLGLTFEAIVPGFHRYHGAQAIGSAADLYVCHPTARARKKGKNSQAIYTRGARSVEAGRTPAPLRAALAAIAAEGGRTVDERGPDWTKPITAEAGTAVAMDLGGDPGSWLLRALLAVNAERVALLLPNAHPDLADAEGQAALADLVSAKYRLRLLRSTPNNTHAVVVAEAVGTPGPPETGSAVRTVWTRAHGRLGNVWPEAPADIAGLRLIDLPRHRIAGIRSAWASDAGPHGSAAGRAAESPRRPGSD